MRARLTAAGAVAALVVITATACGGGSSGGGPGPTAPSSASVPTSPAAPSSQPPPTQPPAADAQLRALVLTPAEVSSLGQPVTERTLPGGNLVKGQVTLDACGAHFPSEAARQARVQVVYVNGGRSIASNEVVRYAPNGTASAYREVQHAVRHCPKSVKEGSGTVQTKLTVVARDPALLSRQLTAVGMLRQVGGNTIWDAATYQYDGNLFSGVYTFGLTRSDALKAAHVLAAISARKLKGSATSV